MEGATPLVRYNICRGDPALPFTRFAEELLAFVDAHPVDRLVVDLRNNAGGAPAVAQPLIEGLAARPALSGQIFVVVGRHTFSSAMMNAIELRAATGALLAGEPTGGKPNGYGAVRTFKLPYSPLVVEYSTEYFALADGDPASLTPDIPATLASADYFGGRDPALAAILAYHP